MDIRVFSSLVGQDPNGGQSYSYGQGDHYGVPEERAKGLIRSGLAEPIGEKKQTAAAPVYEKRKK